MKIETKSESWFFIFPSFLFFTNSHRDDSSQNLKKGKQKKKKLLYVREKICFLAFIVEDTAFHFPQLVSWDVWASGSKSWLPCMSSGSAFLRLCVIPYLSFIWWIFFFFLRDECEKLPWFLLCYASNHLPVPNQ